MKKILFFLLFISSKIFGQSVTILPQSANPSVAGHTLLVPIDAQGYNHSNGTLGIGTYVGSSNAYLQTHTPHSLNFAVNNGTAAMTLSYSTTSSLHRNLGINTTNPQEKLHVVGNIRTSSLAGTGLKPVAADANGTLQPISAVAFSVYLGVNFSIANNTDLTLPFGVENYDIGSNYDITTYSFTAPVNGIYNFSTTTIWSSLTATSGNFLLELKGPSGTFAQSSMPIYSTNKFSTNTISSDIRLNAGQIVRVNVYQTTSISLNLAGNNNPYTAIFSGHLVMPL